MDLAGHVAVGQVCNMFFGVQAVVGGIGHHAVVQGGTVQVVTAVLQRTSGRTSLSYLYRSIQHALHIVYQEGENNL